MGLLIFVNAQNYTILLNATVVIENLQLQCYKHVCELSSLKMCYIHWHCTRETSSISVYHCALDIVLLRCLCKSIIIYNIKLPCTGVTYFYAPLSLTPTQYLSTTITLKVNTTSTITTSRHLLLRFKTTITTITITINSNHTLTTH